MKIVDRQAFLKLPENTVYCEYKPHIFESVNIKGESVSNIDYWSVDIAAPIDCDDSSDMVEKMKLDSIPLDFESETRDGMFNENQLYAVYEKHDIEKLISRLSLALDIKES